MEWKGEELPSCCSRPELTDALIMFRLPIFKAVHCRNCDEITSAMGMFGDLMFQTFFLPFWDGSVYIKQPMSLNRDNEEDNED